MALSGRELDFLEAHQSAAMITVGGDGYPKAARVAVALVDGKLWSSGTQDRVRTRRLRADPRCTLFVFGADQFASLTLEATASILEGPGAPEQSVRLFRAMQRRPTGPLSWFGGELEEEQLTRKMAEEQRLIFEFDVHRAYGMY